MADMADVAKARREARRRKILENSHNRLNLISGKNTDEQFQESESLPIPNNNCDNRVSIESGNKNNCSYNNGVINDDLLQVDFPLIQRNYEPGENLSLTDLANLSSKPPNDELCQTSPLLDKIINNKYDVVLLSLLIPLFYSISGITFDNTYFFLPLILYVTTKLMWCPKQNNYNFANALLLLNVISASRIQMIMLIIHWLEDVCVFIFITVCVQSLSLLIKGTVI